MDTGLITLAKPTISALSRHQVEEQGIDHGGIRDPLSATVPGEHYAATHFAWACLLLHTLEGGDAWLDPAARALRFHLRTSPEEYAPGSWDYHWDFNNLALAEGLALAGGSLPAELRMECLVAMGSWKTNKHFAVNWVAMRARAALLRAALRDEPRQREAASEWLEFVLRAQNMDGGIEDIPGKSLPSQYHAYSACLLHLMRDERPEIVPAVIKAARWLLAVTAPDGEMNALGRGQGQIFGYAAAIYLFRAVSALCPELAPRLLWAAEATTRLLASWQGSDGLFPLVCNTAPHTARAGWYDYHHLSVYNAFAAVWLLKAAMLETPIVEPAPPPEGDEILAASGLLAIRRRRYYALFSAGRPGEGYLTEAGITPHDLYFGGVALFRRPLGPGPGKYGEYAKSEASGQLQNLWAPLALVRGNWLAPVGTSGTIELAGADTHGLVFSRDGLRWKRTILCGERFLEFRDILSSEGETRADRFRPVNIAAKEGTLTAHSGSALLFGPSTCRSVVRAVSNPTLLELQPRGTTMAASGLVEIAAMESATVEETSPQQKKGAVKGRMRLRLGPGKTPGPLPGIVCLSWDQWSDLWKRKQRLLYDLAASNRAGKTLYVEPPVTGTAIVEGAHLLLSRTPLGARLRRALRPGVLSPGKNFRLLSPVLPYPGNRSLRAAARANAASLARQIVRAIKREGLTGGYILWLYHPSQLSLLEILGARAELIVYDWTDDWTQAFPAWLPEADRRRLERDQEELLRRADVVLTVSEALRRRAAKVCPWTYLLPNATDPTVFRPPGPGEALQPVLSDISSPRLVYLSQITERLDVSMLATVARARPDWTFLLVGPVVCRESVLTPLRPLPNVVFTGPLPYNEAARVAAQADVCLLPHIVDELTATLDPIKLYDYLATGRPIVSTNVAMHPDLREHVHVAADAREFEAAIAKALAEPSEAIAPRREAAMAHQWEVRVREALDILGRFFSPEGPCA